MRTESSASCTRTRTTTLQAGAALNKPLGNWYLALTADGGHVETKSNIDNNGYVAADRALSKTDSLTSLATLSGRPLRLPGGEASLTVKAGFDYSGIESSDTRTTTGEVVCVSALVTRLPNT